MKILVDLKRVRQEWDPDTQEQTNAVILVIAGRPFTIPCSVEDVEAIVSASVDGTLNAEQSAEDWDDTQGESIENDRVFGGDFESREVPAPPPLFTSEDFEDKQEERELTDQELRVAQIKARQSEAMKLRTEKKDALKERARKAPPRRVAADEMGYPVGVETRQVEQAPAAVADEDGFQQG